MATGLKDTGEELFIKRIFRDDEITMPSDFDIGLFNDTTDALGDSDDLSSVTTEPAGTYARQTASADTADIKSSINNSSNWFACIADVSFDTSSLSSSQSVDAYFVEACFGAGGGAAAEHLIWVGSLDQTYDLSNIDTFTLQDAGIIFD